jgi:hypothetical protein
MLGIKLQRIWTKLCYTNVFHVPKFQSLKRDNSQSQNTYTDITGSALLTQDETAQTLKLLSHIISHGALNLEKCND